MKEHPILFSGPMVRAILDGRKTQTRRIVKPQPSSYIPSGEGPPSGLEAKHTAPYFDAYNGGPRWCWWDQWDRQGPDWIKCPYGQPGDRLWVRETWADLRGMGFDKQAEFRANCVPGSDGDDARKAYGVKWKPSIHMPRWASRITLEVTGVRVERLNDISEDDAKAEGCEQAPPFEWPEKPTNYRDGFRTLWESINGEKHPWASNCWVWVIDFRRVQ